VAEVPVRLKGTTRKTKPEDAKRLYNLVYQVFVASEFGIAFDLFQAMLSLVACAVYIASTYLVVGDDPLPISLVIIEVILTFFFLLDYVLHLYLSQSKCRFIFSCHSMVDVLAIAPSITLFLPAAKIGFVRLLRGVRVVRVLRVNRIFAVSKDHTTEVQQQMVVLSITMIAFLLICSGLLFVVNDISPDNTFSTKDDQFTFFDAFYFTVISISTVGYGDIYPLSAPARIICMMIILGLIALVPRETAKLSALMDKTSAYDRAYELSSYPHVLVVSKPVCSSIGMFLLEFYHADHGEQETRVVILDPSEPCDEFKDLIESTEYAKLVSYVKGSAMSDHSLRKVKAAEACSVFILPDNTLTNPAVADLASLLTAKSISNVSQAQFYIQLLQPSSEDHCEWADSTKDTQSVCIQSLKMGMVATSCLCPGSFTMLSNLIISTGEVENVTSEWCNEYISGFGQEVYTVNVAPGFAGWHFQEMAAEAYVRYGVCIFALSVQGEPGIGQQPRTLINPSNYIICGVEQCVLIADDMTEAERFSKHVPRVRKPLIETKIKESKLSDLAELQNNQHIVLCGAFPHGLRSFMKALRLGSAQTVIYLHPYEPNNEVQAIFEEFNQFFFMQGSPLVVSDLKDAGTEGAQMVVIFPDREETLLDGRASAHGFSDMFAAYVANTITEHFQGTPWFAELLDPASMRFLRNPGLAQEPHSVWPCYCSGTVYIANLFDSLIAQAFYNRDLIQILSDLIGSQPEDINSDSEPPPLEEIMNTLLPDHLWNQPLGVSHRQLHGDTVAECRKLRHIPVPSEYVGQAYHKVFQDLILNHGSLPLGIYRGVVDGKMNPQEYVVTNPTQMTTLRSNDHLYVLTK